MSPGKGLLPKNSHLLKKAFRVYQFGMSLHRGHTFDMTDARTKRRDDIASQTGTEESLLLAVFTSNLIAMLGMSNASQKILW